MDDKEGISFMPDPSSVSPSFIPPVPAPVPVLMPLPATEAISDPNSETGSNSETMEDNPTPYPGTISPSLFEYQLPLSGPVIIPPSDEEIKSGNNKKAEPNPTESKK